MGKYQLTIFCGKVTLHYITPHGRVEIKPEDPRWRIGIDEVMKALRA